MALILLNTSGDSDLNLSKTCEPFCSFAQIILVNRQKLFVKYEKYDDGNREENKESMKESTEEKEKRREEDRIKEMKKRNGNKYGTSSSTVRQR